MHIKSLAYWHLHLCLLALRRIVCPGQLGEAFVGVNNQGQLVFCAAPGKDVILYVVKCCDVVML